MEPSTWSVRLCQAPCAEPIIFAHALMFPCCTAYALRDRVIEGDLDAYRCCQGYGRFMNFGEDRCPHLCMVAESSLCFAASVYASRWAIMQKYGIRDARPDRAFAGTWAAAVAGASAASVAMMALGEVLGVVGDVGWLCLCGCAQTQVAHEICEREDPRSLDALRLFRFRARAPHHLDLSRDSLFPPDPSLRGQTDRAAAR